MRLSRQEVLHIAELAKLRLTEAEVALYGEQLSEILAYAERLNALDTDAIPPTAQAIPQRNVTRADLPQASLAPEDALANAPQRQGDFIKVRTILE